MTGWNLSAKKITWMELNKEKKTIDLGHVMHLITMHIQHVLMKQVIYNICVDEASLMFAIRII
jgi:hypothetical protein